MRQAVVGFEHGRICLNNALLKNMQADMQKQMLHVISHHQSALPSFLGVNINVTHKY